MTSAVVGRTILAFEGTELPAAIAEHLARGDAAGVTLYRHLNDAPPERLRALTDAIHAAAGRRGPALIGADQEGGQLVALATGTTAFAGAMALGAVGDPDLARRVGAATGRELRALGLTVAYAPVCDLTTGDHNPALGVRSFGADPAEVGRLAAAFVEGLASAGVAAAIKHFPGLGGVTVDPHRGTPIIEADDAALEAGPLVPFRAAIDAGAKLVMSTHVAVPALTGDAALPATRSAAVMTGLLRDRLGFTGLALTDALDMGGVGSDADGGIGAAGILAAGHDLLLCGPDPAAQTRLLADLGGADARRASVAGASATAARRADLRTWLSAVPQPPLGVVGSADHAALAREVARRSVTRVRDRDGILPLRLAPGATILAVMPAPTDLTPADTSSTVTPGLAAALRRVYPRVDEIVVPRHAGDVEIAAVRTAALRADAVVIGTIDAVVDPSQGRLVRAILATGRPTVTVALRMPTDLAAYPDSGTALATYSILPESLDALAALLVGAGEASGLLPIPAAWIGA